MSYVYIAENRGPLSNPEIIARYREEGVYNSEPYYVKDEGLPNWSLFYSTVLGRWHIHQFLDPAAFSYYGSSFEGTYDATLPYTGRLEVSIITPKVYRESAQNQLNLTNTVAVVLAPSEIHFAWVRWIYASINKHFDDRKGKYELYIEGDERTQSNEAEFAELRIDGPFITIPQKGLYLLDVEINVLTQTHLDPRKHYLAQEMVGAFARAFTNMINVYKYGDGPLDDGSLLGCFHMQRDLRETLDINYYGIIKEDVKITQSTIEGHYRLELWSKGD